MGMEIQKADHSSTAIINWQQATGNGHFGWHALEIRCRKLNGEKS
jgi:hypothetical protein